MNTLTLKWTDETTRIVIGASRLHDRLEPSSPAARTRVLFDPCVDGFEGWKRERERVIAVDRWLMDSSNIEVRTHLKDVPEIDLIVGRLESGEVLDEGDLFVLKRLLYRAEKIAKMNAPHCEIESARCAKIRQAIHPESKPSPRFKLSEKLDPAYRNALENRRKARKERDALREELETRVKDSDHANGRFDVRGDFRGDVNPGDDLPLVRAGDVWHLSSGELDLAEQKLDDAHEAVETSSYVLRRRLSQQVATEIEALTAWANELVELDLRVARAMLRRELDGVWPEAGGSTWVSIVSGRHPDVDEAQPVSIELESASNLIIGPNMGGKSALLKLVGLALYAAHHLLPFSAHSLRFEWTQSLVYVGSDEPYSGESAGGLSSFGREIRRVVTSLERARGAWLLDEVGRGTHPDDGAQILERILEILRRRDDRVLCATHFSSVENTNMAHFQIRGLEDPDALEAEIQALTAEAFFDVNALKDRLSRHMNYQPQKVTGAVESRDAMRIARALGLDVDDSETTS